MLWDSDYEPGRTGNDQKGNLEGSQMIRIRRVRKCSQCDQKFPLSEKYFHRNPSRKDGYHSICKKCRLRNDSEIYKEARLDRPRFSRGSKWFRSSANSNDGFQGNNEKLIYMDISGEGLQNAITTEHVHKAKEIADQAGNPIIWRRGDPIEGLPERMKERIERERQ